MNFIEALKSGKPFRYKSWGIDIYAKIHINTKRYFILFNNTGVIEKDYSILISELIDETGWEVLKEKKKIDTTLKDILYTKLVDKIPINSKVTVEWEE